MDTKMIEVLIKQLEQSSLHELELTLGNDSLHLVKASPAAAPAPVTPAPENTAATPVTPVPDKPQADEGTAVKAPLVGIVYLAPKPGADPYFQVGDHVKKGDVVCIIESMKMMNEIKAEQAGRLEEIFVKDGQTVEYAQPMFLIK